MSNKSALTEDFIEGQRQRLEALRSELMGDDTAAAIEATGSQEELGGEAQEYEDAAQDLEQKEVLQAKHDVDLQRLAAIERALQKIALGTYGVSDASGKAIPKDRLEAIPEATLRVEEAAGKQ